MSPTEENYLKNLFYLENKLGEATVNELSKSLDIKMSTVNSMMKKFAEKGLIHYESYKPLKLTETGRQQAALILRKHRLTEMFLYERMGLGWEEVHSIAEQIEHIDSTVFFDRMDELLNHPHIDPHGSPIPDKKGNIPQIDYHRLSDCKIGETVTLSAVMDSSEDFLNFLSKRSLTLGVKLIVESVENFDGSMTVNHQEKTSEVLSKFVCDRLLVVKL